MDSYKQHLKCLKLLYLNFYLKLRNKLCNKLCPYKLRPYKLCLYKLCPASKLDKNVRSKNLCKNVGKKLRKKFCQFH